MYLSYCLFGVDLAELSGLFSGCFSIGWLCFCGFLDVSGLLGLFGIEFVLFSLFQCCCVSSIILFSLFLTYLSFSIKDVMSMSYLNADIPTLETSRLDLFYYLFYCFWSTLLLVITQRQTFFTIETTSATLDFNCILDLEPVLLLLLWAYSLPFLLFISC